jgi:hypothetical protein
MIRSLKQMAVIIVLALPVIGHAAGYLEFDNQGRPYKWDGPVEYRVDMGPLSTLIDNTAGNILVDNVFANWAAIGGLTFVEGLPAPADINNVNFNTYINYLGSSCPAAVNDVMLIMFDDDGAWFNDEFGDNNGILGIASPSGLNSQLKVTCGYALINGLAIDGYLADAPNAATYIMMHEFGHAFNLEHSQIEVASEANLPLMYPIIPDNLLLALGGGMNGIKLDDQFSFRHLYDTPTLATQGTIRGTVKTKEDNGVLGANVICRDRDNPDQNAVSWVSDAVLDGNGAYECRNLPAGQYDVEIQPIQVAINNWEGTIPPFVPSEFYSGDDESFDPDVDDLESSSAVNVSLAATTNLINIVINEDGRVVSEKKITGSIGPQNTTDFEHLVYVPKSVSSAKFELSGAPSSADIDIYGRCNDPFSIVPPPLVPPIYNPGSPQFQQAEFAGASIGPTELVTLNSSSTPKIENCDYHLILVNYSSSNATYELTVTLVGDEPRLRTDFVPTKSRQDNGETLVSRVTFQAENDQFAIKSFTLTDLGIDSLSSVTAASIYEDDNNNGEVDDGDDLLATTSSINASTRKFTLSGLGIFVDEDDQKNYLITYTMPASASFSWIAAFLLLGMTLSLIFLPKSRYATLSIVLISMIFLGRCSSGGNEPFNPRVEKETEINAVASGFGEKFSVQTGKPDSVEDFFK